MWCIVSLVTSVLAHPIEPMLVQEEPDDSQQQPENVTTVGAPDSDAVKPAVKIPDDETMLSPDGNDDSIMENVDTQHDEPLGEEDTESIPDALPSSSGAHLTVAHAQISNSCMKRLLISMFVQVIYRYLSSSCNQPRPVSLHHSLSQTISCQMRLCRGSAVHYP